MRLGDIVVEGGTRGERINFYTAQYHAKLTPNLMSDVNGEYRRSDRTIARVADGRAYYSTFSLWDTFRAWHPLQTLVDTARVNDMIASLLDMYDATGELPVWPLASGETGTMIGYHAVSVIADAYLKGIRGYDAGKALDAMIRSSNINKKGSNTTWRRASSCRTSAANRSPAPRNTPMTTAVARMAEASGAVIETACEWGRPPGAQLRPCSTVRPAFPPAGRRRLVGAFHEFMAGRDYTGRLSAVAVLLRAARRKRSEQLSAAGEAFVRELDRLSLRSNRRTRMWLADITGLMGQYAHGNEPSHHMALPVQLCRSAVEDAGADAPLLTRCMPRPRREPRQRGLRADVGVVYLLSLFLIRCVRVRTNFRADGAAVRKATVRRWPTAAR